ncbi:MAG: spermidine/putrescine ABC transporter substrate-binding protein PotF, partial [Paracoccaceae bacterium]|nr:spermidine/putrescine ABC transporter substrate-binding protein PotF [Paracoccaceae bacterium]
TWYATANLAAKPMVDEEVTSSPAAFPTSAQIDNMYTTAVLGPKVDRMETRTWTNFKAGN